MKIKKCKKVDCKFINEDYECMLNYTNDDINKCSSYKEDKFWNDFVIQMQKQNIKIQEDDAI